MNNKKKVFLYIGIPLAVILIIVVIGGLTALFLTRFESIYLGNDSDWLSFYGSLIGSLLSGLFTVLAVRLTINYTEKENKLSRMPILKIEEKKQPNDKFFSISYMPFSKMQDLNQNKDNICREKIYLEIENIGLTHIKSFMIANSAYSDNDISERLNALSKNQKKILEIEIALYKCDNDHLKRYTDYALIKFIDYANNYYYSEMVFDYSFNNKDSFDITYLGHTATNLSTLSEVKKIGSNKNSLTEVINN